MKNDICNAILMAILMAMVLSGCVMNLGGSLAISNRSNTDVAVADTDGKVVLKQEGDNSLAADKTTEAKAAVSTSGGEASVDARKSLAQGREDSAEAPAETGGDVK